MMTPFESAVRGSLEESRGGRTHVHYRNDLGDRATPLSGTQLRKRVWEERNLRRGVDLSRRHAGWLEAQDRREFERRREERRVWFANLAQPLRQAYATSWDEHRRRYGYATSKDGRL